MGAIFEFLFYQPIYNLLMFFYSASGANLGIAIILIALVVKLITIPLTKKQMESGKKMKVFQEKSKQVKEKYKKNKEKQNEEMMKLTSEYMPAQLSGCLPMIISIIFLIQVRNVVVSLVNQGFESFNRVAYVESLKFDVDSATVKSEQELKEGENTMKLIVEASNGKKYEETITFIKSTNEDEAKSKLKEIDKNRTESEKAEIAKQAVVNRESGIAVHIVNFDKGKLVTDSKPTFEIFFRPPSNKEISNIDIALNGQQVEKSQLNVTKGEKLNLNFFGMDLSKVGLDYVGQWIAFIPYLILSLLIGLSQFATTKLQMGFNPEYAKRALEQKKQKEKKKDGKSDEPDFSEIMQQSSQQMIYMMPLMTSAIALGFLGGANLFPTAVSLFWTANNVFVIIQQLYDNKAEVMKYINSFRRSNRSMDEVK